MALSNIFREPQREITESLLGFVVVGTVLAGIGLLDYPLAVWFYDITGGPDGGCPVPLGMIMAPILLIAVVLVSILALMVVHAVGEGICDSLEEHGIRLRPRNRR